MAQHCYIVCGPVFLHSPLAKLKLAGTICRLRFIQKLEYSTTTTKNNVGLYISLGRVPGQQSWVEAAVPGRGCSSLASDLQWLRKHPLQDSVSVFFESRQNLNCAILLAPPRLEFLFGPLAGKRRHCFFYNSEKHIQRTCSWASW